MDKKEEQDAGLLNLGSLLDAAFDKEFPDTADTKTPAPPTEEPPDPAEVTEPVAETIPSDATENEDNSDETPPNTEPVEEDDKKAEAAKAAKDDDTDSTNEDDDEDVKQHLSPHDSPNVKKRLAKLHKKHKAELAKREEDYRKQLEEKERLAAEKEKRALELEEKIKSIPSDLNPDEIAQLRWLHDADKAPEIKAINNEIKTAESIAYNIAAKWLKNPTELKIFENGGFADYITKKYKEVKDLANRIEKTDTPEGELDSAKLLAAVSKIVTLQDEKEQKIIQGKSNAKQYFETRAKQPDERRAKETQERAAYAQKAREELPKQFEWFKPREIKAEMPEKERKEIEAYNNVIQQRYALYDGILTKDDFTIEDRKNIGAFVTGAMYYKEAATVLAEENQKLKAELEKIRKARSVNPRPAASEKPPIEPTKTKPRNPTMLPDFDSGLDKYEREVMGQ